jgi:hypothetical protein
MSTLIIPKRRVFVSCQHSHDQLYYEAFANIEGFFLSQVAATTRYGVRLKEPLVRSSKNFRF